MKLKLEKEKGGKINEGMIGLFFEDINYAADGGLYAEGIGHSTSMARRIEAATGIETRATILGYMQRGGNPTCKDRFYASIMGAYAADILCEGKTNRVVGYQHGEFQDFDIEEAMAMEKSISEYQY